MDRPKRPLTIWIALTLLVLLEALLMILGIVPIYILAISDVSPDTVLTIRLVIFVLVLAGVLIAIPAIWLRKRWGAWLAVSAILLFNLLVFIRVPLGEPLPKDQLVIVLFFLITVAPLLIVVRASRAYFSPHEPPPLPEPPSPPVFED